MSNQSTKLKLLKYPICFLFYLLFSTNIYCQQSSLNLYSNWSYFPNQPMSHIDNDDSKFGYNGLSFSYRNINQNLTFYEFELKSGARFKKETESNSKRIYNHVRYEIGKQKKEKLFNKLNFQYGLAFRLFHLYTQTDPQVADAFKSEEHKIGVSAALTTNLIYDINNKFYAQLKISLIDITIAGGVSKTHRPNLPESSRRNGNLDIDYLGAQTLRFGIGYKFNKIKS